MRLEVTGRKLEAIVSDGDGRKSSLLRAQPQPGSDNSVFVVRYNGLTQGKASVKRPAQPRHFPLVFLPLEPPGASFSARKAANGCSSGSAGVSGDSNATPDLRG